MDDLHEWVCYVCCPAAPWLVSWKAIVCWKGMNEGCGSVPVVCCSIVNCVAIGLGYIACHVCLGKTRQSTPEWCNAAMLHKRSSSVESSVQHGIVSASHPIMLLSTGGLCLHKLCSSTLPSGPMNGCWSEYVYMWLS